METPPRFVQGGVGAGERDPACIASLGATAPPPSGPTQETPPADFIHTARATSRKTDPAACAIGARIDRIFMVLDIEERAGDAPHTILILGCADGQLRSAPFWTSESHRLAGVAVGAAVHVRGHITRWRDRPQLTVDSLAPIPADQADWEALLPSIGDPVPWWARLDRWRSQVATPLLRHTLAHFFEDPVFRSRFQRCPASPQGHHARLGGLLQHTCEVAHLALTAADGCAEVDIDLLLTGALLHDIGKLESYRWEGAFTTTVAGQVLGHVVLGALRIARVMEPAMQPALPDTSLPLLHLIVSHHGRLEFGAAVPPMTLEAELLHQADLTSARRASMMDALTDPENFGTGPVSRRPVWQLDRRKVWRHRAPASS